ncbi:MAG TPA: tRNA pseudouridine(55) synthase TruB [Legionella sp.]|nr:tRNA pseudouridine(55) synthase TruB [Legionella sp.]
MNEKPTDKQVVNGLLLVNKPRDLTSNAVLQQVKRLFHAKKAGHTGSLDPLATGMLPLCFGEATKFSQYLLDADKCYEVTGLLGIKTNTADAMGEEIARVDDFTISEDALKAVLAEFIGPIFQLPSMFSALKHHGKPLYKFAREGIDIERKPREVTIHDLQLNGFDGRLFQLTVTCSKGTYIRNLVEDIGERLGVYAHVTKLHRTYTAGLADEPMYPLDALAGMSHAGLHECLLPMERAVDYLPPLTLDDDAVFALRQGKMVCIPDAMDWTVGVRLYDNEKQLIGLGEWESAGVLKVKRLLGF